MVHMFICYNNEGCKVGQWSTKSDSVMSILKSLVRHEENNKFTITDLLWREAGAMIKLLKSLWGACELTEPIRYSICAGTYMDCLRMLCLRSRTTFSRIEKPFFLFITPIHHWITRKKAKQSGTRLTVSNLLRTWSLLPFTKILQLKRWPHVEAFLGHVGYLRIIIFAPKLT